MTDCIFCKIGRAEIWTSILFEDSEVIAFADNEPVRPGHVQVVPKAHYPYFDDLPAELAARLVTTGQAIAKAQKQIYGVERCAFLFTGGDIAHVHAHVYPVHHKHDVTSRRYIVEDNITFRSIPVANDQLEAEMQKLRRCLDF